MDSFPIQVDYKTGDTSPNWTQLLGKDVGLRILECFKTFSDDRLHGLPLALVLGKSNFDTVTKDLKYSDREFRATQVKLRLPGLKSYGRAPHFWVI